MAQKVNPRVGYAMSAAVSQGDGLFDRPAPSYDMRGLYVRSFSYQAFAGEGRTRLAVEVVDAMSASVLQSDAIERASLIHDIRRL